MSEIYSLILKPKSGWITPLQADTIFGHLCWKIENYEGKEKLESFLEEMGAGETEKEPFFVISNVFPNGYIPRPRLEVEFKKEKEGNKLKTNEEFEKIKKYNKDVNLIKIEDLNKYFVFSEIEKMEIKKEKKERKGKEKIDKIMEEITEKLKEEKNLQSFEKDREIKTTINRLTSMTLEEQGPYSLPYFSLSNNKKKEGTERNNLWLLMKVFDEDKVKKFKVKEYLKKVFEEGYGKRKSIGKGIFEVEDWKEEKNFQNENGEYVVSLSNFVPQKNNPADGLYEIFVKYGKLGEEKSIVGAGNFYKKPLIMIKQGATFKNHSSDKQYLGRMLKKISSYPEIRHYAYGFSLRF